MKRTAKQLGAAILFTMLVCAEVSSSEDELAEVLRQVEGSTSQTEIQAAMTRLAAIDSAHSAEAFSETFKEKVIPLKLNLIPFLALMYDFREAPQTRGNFVGILKTLDGEELDPYESVYVVGLLARFGETERVGWLISEYREASKSFTNLSYPSMILKVLCKSNVSEASDFVVELVRESGDPTIKLVSVHNMQEAGNPRAIDIMRDWQSVAPGNFDQVANKYYLRSIIAFGDDRDREYLDWFELNAERLFPLEDIERQFRPLLIEAKNSIALRSEEKDHSAPDSPVGQGAQ